MKASELQRLRSELIECRRLLKERLEEERYKSWVAEVNAKITKINTITRISKTPGEYFNRMRELSQAR